MKISSSFRVCEHIFWVSAVLSHRGHCKADLGRGPDSVGDGTKACRIFAGPKKTLNKCWIGNLVNNTSVDALKGRGKAKHNTWRPVTRISPTLKGISATSGLKSPLVTVDIFLLGFRFFTSSQETSSSRDQLPQRFCGVYSRGRWLTL